MQNLVLASADQAWSFGGSIMTFLLPMIAFAVVALALLIWYTKPELVPGRRVPGAEISVGATREPGLPAQAGVAAESNHGSAAAPPDSASRPDHPAGVE